MIKSSIKEVLKNWQLYADSANLTIIDIIMPIQTSIKALLDSGQLNTRDLEIIDAYSLGYNYSEISRLFKVSRQTVATKIDRVAILVSIELGEL